VERNALYNDGRTAATHRVVLRVDGDVLVVETAEGAALDRWLLSEVHLTARPEGGMTPRLRRGFDDDARVTLADTADLAALSAHCPNLDRINPAWSRYGRPMVIWGGVAILSSILFVTVVVPLAARQIASHLSPSWEERVGTETASHIAAVLAPGKAVCSKGAGAEILQGLADRLAAGLDRPLRIHPQVVDTPMINALALPGGEILVFRGLIDQAESADEVAGVLAHEIGHVYRHHPIEVAIRQAGTSILIGLMLGDVTGGTVIAGLGQAMAGAAYGRDAEREADEISLDLLNRAGLDAHGIADFLDRIGGKNHDAEEALSFLSTHPFSADRARRMRSGATGRGHALTDAEWKSLKGIC
jgi:Zn-dependent protease with chaperone function